jgi:hypothetical protein
MAVKVLALASGVTSLADHRILNGAMLAPAGLLHARGGVIRTPGGGDLSTVSAMVARVAAVKVVIPNGVSSALGPYLLVSDANVDITFDAGEASVARTDRIIARAYDNTNDGSGLTEGSIYYLKGQASGTATALPTNSVLLYEISVPAGASAGSGGINFATAQDRRVYTTAHGGIIPIGSNTDMNAITSPYEGMTVYRTDIDILYVYDGTTWRPRGQANVASSANLTNINNPYDGMIAVTRDTDYIYVYNGTTWNPIQGYTWTTVASFGTNWANYGSVWSGARYTKDSSNIVYLDGMLRTNAATNSNIMFTLPAGYRPSHPILLPMATETNARFRLWIDELGNVRVYALDTGGIVTNTWFSLAGASFPAA